MGRVRWVMVEGQALVGFGTQLRSLARHSLESGLDAGNGAAGVTRLALKEIKTRVLLQDCVRRPTRVTCHILLCKSKTVRINLVFPHVMWSNNIYIKKIN